MAKYTMTVFELLESNFDFELNEYPIFDESYRVLLNNAILEYYKFYEIGFINPILWRDRLKQRMNLIMRNKYNELYKNKMLEFNPLYNIDLTETYTHEINNNSSGTTRTNENSNGNTSTNENQSANARVINSVYPSEELNEVELSTRLFANNGTHQKQDNESENNSNYSQENSSTGETNQQGTTLETYTRTNKGSSAGLPFSKAMLQFKQFVEQFNLDEQVINELKDLFITIW